jgi:uncharacterized iron-regulated protein
MTRRPAALAALFAFLAASAPPAAEAKLIFRLRDTTTMSTAQLVASLKGARVIFFGENHDRAEDHVAQRTIMQALQETGVPMAVGMEMFRRDAQPQLDRWVAGTLDMKGLRGLYDGNWDAALFEQYRDILLYARQERIPLIGLNIASQIVAQVGRGGFASLSAEQRRQLGVNSCDVSPRYADVLHRLTGRPLGSPDFANFCEAQIVWDAAMARTIADFLRAKPDHVVLVFCGNFHAWRHGIPGRLAAITDVPMKIILPSGDDSFQRYDILREDADYIWWNQ